MHGSRHDSADSDRASTNALDDSNLISPFSYEPTIIPGIRHDSEDREIFPASHGDLDPNANNYEAFSSGVAMGKGDSAGLPKATTAHIPSSCRTLTKGEELYSML